MKWTRPTADGGRYEAGPYVVENLGRHGWAASGPGFRTVHATKADAQSDCGDAALERIAGQEATVGPVVGDIVVVTATGRRGQVSAIMNGTHHPLYCIRFARGKRLCLDRHEFEVLVP
ncbi:hypothetical protein I5G60_gp88 [Mycobacterium phage Saguaro]|uniref:Uncharacterized protein n=1 Tax=Mycobacterium phage Saguaro TaxID=2315616 RepID=A0A386KCZ4_9CAUD|nr:hypothetical protein I5G60_gp88 [Mycobacterium phage Saguaro]AYD82080.1 hypothetical protein SEA_SAGUARO_88 [Mycobacterium phage Saguaro]